MSNSLFVVNIVVIVISIFGCLDVVSSKIIMDDIDVEANPEYLNVTASIDKKIVHDPVVNVHVDLKRDIEHLKVEVSLEADVGGEFKEIYPPQYFNPCEDSFEDELVKYVLDIMEKYGNLKIQCPFKQGHYFIENFKIGDDDGAVSGKTSLKHFNFGRYRVDVKVFTMDETSTDVEVLGMRFGFHGSQ